MAKNMTQSSPTHQLLIDQGIINAPDSAKGRLLQAAATLFKEKGYERDEHFQKYHARKVNERRAAKK